MIIAFTEKVSPLFASKGNKQIIASQEMNGTQAKLNPLLDQFPSINAISVPFKPGNSDWIESGIRSQNPAFF